MRSKLSERRESEVSGCTGNVRNWPEALKSLRWKSTRCGHPAGYAGRIERGLCREAPRPAAGANVRSATIRDDARLRHVAPITPFGRLPSKKSPNEAREKPKREIQFEDEEKAAGMLSDLHPYEHTAHGEAPLQYANAPDEVPYTFRSCFCPL